MSSDLTIKTLSKNKLLIIFLLVIFLSVLLFITVNDISKKGNIYFIIIEIVLFFYSLDYIQLFLRAYNTITFNNEHIKMNRRKKETVMQYSDIRNIKEIRNNFIEIYTQNKLPFIVHSENYPLKDTDNNKRTINIIRKQIKERSGKSIEVSYKVK